jgi:serine/threonine protein kinase
MDRIRRLTFSELKRRIEKIPTEDFSSFLLSQALHELEFIRQHEDTRELIEINKAVKGLKNFNIDKVIKLNRSEFFSEEQVEFFKYFTRSILRFNRNSYRFFSKLRYWFRNFRKISSGSSGDVYSASIKGSKERPFVFKFAKNDYNMLTQKAFIYHEYLVSHYFINELRKKCPNFSMAFGLLECSSPDLVFGTPINSISCIVYENISPSIPLYGALRTGISPDDFLSIFIQICLALYLACSEFGFTHNDLHVANVLIKECDKTLYIPYYYKGRKIYVAGRHLAVIIDYGLSRIEIEKKNFGPFGMPRKSMNEYYKAYPVKDIFSILVTSYIEAYESKKEDLCSIIKEILNLLISKRTTYGQLRKIFELSLFYPFFEELEGIRGIEYVLDYVIKNLNRLCGTAYAKDRMIVEKITSQTTGIILDCNYTACHTLDEIYDIVYKRLPINDILYYLDLKVYDPDVMPSKRVLEYNLDILVTNIKKIREQYSHLKEIGINQIDSKEFIEYYILSKDTVEIYNALKIFVEDSRDHISNEIQSLKTDIDKIKSDVNMFIKELMKIRDRDVFEKVEIESESLEMLTFFLPSPIL